MISTYFKYKNKGRVYGIFIVPVFLLDNYGLGDYN